MNLRAPLAFLLLGALAPGCDEPLEDFGEVSLRPGSGTYGGVWMNTGSIGATAFSEIDLQGCVHDGVRLINVQVKRPGNKWVTATKIEVVDGNLRARSGNTVYQGAELIGSRWKLHLADGDGDGDVDAADGPQKPVEMWISAHTQVSARESRYVFEAADPLGEVSPLCPADSAGQHTAVALRDLTVDADTGDIAARPGTIYLACTSGAVGKAVTWGYRPWERALADFEVATRMVRADYCYDGTPWTEDGAHLQVRDAWNINTFLHAADPTEVVWTKTGVRCVHQPRNPAYTPAQIKCNGAPLPACPANTSMSTYPGTLFWTKLDGA